MKRIALALAITLALGACKGGGKQQGAGTAAGEILPGSASDAMLPYDTVRSQAPLAPHTAAAHAEAAGSDAAGEPATDAATPDAGATAPAPAAPAT